jgi:hypothetical protein
LVGSLGTSTSRPGSSVLSPITGVEVVEAAVERYYRTVQLSRARQERIRAAIKARLDEMAAISGREVSRCHSELRTLDSRNGSSSTSIIKTAFRTRSMTRSGDGSPPSVRRPKRSSPGPRFSSTTSKRRSI